MLYYLSKNCFIKPYVFYFFLFLLFEQACLYFTFFNQPMALITTIDDFISSAFWSFLGAPRIHGMACVFRASWPFKCKHSIISCQISHGRWLLSVQEALTRCTL